MEPAAIWIYHPDGSSKHMRITPEQANAEGWSIYHDYRDLIEKPIDTPVPVEESASQVKFEGRYTCDICGKVCSNAVGLSGHKRSHK